MAVGVRGGELRRCRHFLETEEDSVQVMSKKEAVYPWDQSNLERPFVCHCCPLWLVLGKGLKGELPALSRETGRHSSWTTLLSAVACRPQEGPLGFPSGMN